MTVLKSKLRGLFNKEWDKIHKKFIIKDYTFILWSPSVLPIKWNAFFWSSFPLLENSFEAIVWKDTAPIIALRDAKRQPLRSFFIVGNRKKSQGAKSGLYGGCGTISMLFVAKNWRASFATWGRAISSAARNYHRGMRVISEGCECRSISWELFCNISHWWFALQAHNGWKSALASMCHMIWMYIQGVLYDSLQHVIIGHHLRPWCSWISNSDKKLNVNKPCVTCRKTAFRKFCKI